MRRGQPGRWMIEAPSEDRARQKAEAAGVTLERVDPIGQITSATMAFALAAGSPAHRRRSGHWPTAWIAACAACAAVFGTGGYFLGSHLAPTATAPVVHVQAPTATTGDPMANAIAAAASTPKASPGSKSGRAASE